MSGSVGSGRVCATRTTEIVWVIGIAGRTAPFRANCYPQALAAAQLCRWLAVPHAVQLGARFAAKDRIILQRA